ncbi:Fc.00g037400.m01.CDS01 [Cosmosporella sp. VM-42]
MASTCDSLPEVLEASRVSPASPKRKVETQESPASPGKRSKATISKATGPPTSELAAEKSPLTEVGLLSTHVNEVLLRENDALRGMLKLIAEEAEPRTVSLKNLESIIDLTKRKLAGYDAGAPGLDGVLPTLKELIVEASGEHKSARIQFGLKPDEIPSNFRSAFARNEEIVDAWKFGTPYSLERFAKVMEYTDAAVQGLVALTCDVPLSQELATSEKAKVFEPVCPNFVEMLTKPLSSVFVLHAGIWHILVSEFFEKPSPLWCGSTGEDFDRVCSSIQDKLPSGNHPDELEEVGWFHEIRARFTGLLQDYLMNEDIGEDIFPPTPEMVSRLVTVLEPYFSKDVEMENVYDKVEDIFWCVGRLTKQMRCHREKFRLVMAGSLEEPDRRHDFEFDPRTMAAYNNLMLPSHDVPRGGSVAFVVAPLLARRGVARDPKAMLSKMDHETVVHRPRVLLAGDKLPEHEQRGAVVPKEGLADRR